MSSVPPRTRDFCCLLVGLLNTATMVVVLCCRFRMHARTVAKQGEGVRWCPAPAAEAERRLEVGVGRHWHCHGLQQSHCNTYCTIQTHPARCGRTTRNSVLTNALVFHQTLSTPKATTMSGIRRAHPEGEPERSTFFPRIQ